MSQDIETQKNPTETKRLEGVDSTVLFDFLREKLADAEKSLLSREQMATPRRITEEEWDALKTKPGALITKGHKLSKAARIEIEMEQLRQKRIAAKCLWEVAMYKAVIAALSEPNVKAHTSLTEGELRSEQNSASPQPPQTTAGQGLCDATCSAFSSFEGAETRNDSSSFLASNSNGGLLRGTVIGAKINVDHRCLRVGERDVRNVVNVDPDFHRLPASADSILIVNVYNLGKGHIIKGLVELLRSYQAKQMTLDLRELVGEGFDVLDIMKQVGDGISGDDWSMYIRGPLLEVLLPNDRALATQPAPQMPD